MNAANFIAGCSVFAVLAVLAAHLVATRRKRRDREELGIGGRGVRR